MRDQIVPPGPRAGLEWPHLIPSNLVLIALNTDSYKMHLIRAKLSVQIITELQNK